MLEERLGVEIEALVPTDYAGVIVALQSDQAQIAGGLGPVQMVQAEDEADADLILQSERFGSFEYVTQWFTNDPATFCEDEPVADEDGFLFCNGVLDATSAVRRADRRGAPRRRRRQDRRLRRPGLGVGLPRAVTAAAQRRVSTLWRTSRRSSPAPTTRAVQAVYDGDADVGVSFNDARGDLVEQFPDVGEQVVVFAWSFPIPNDGFAVAGDLPDDLKEAITAALPRHRRGSRRCRAARRSDLYEIDGLRPVDSADFDVIRELRTELADLLE